MAPLTAEDSVCLLNGERTRTQVYWARELAIEQPGPKVIDCSIWAALQQFIYWQKIRDLDHLKEVLTSCWEQIGQDLIDKAINQWLIRISLVMRAKGGHI